MAALHVVWSIVVYCGVMWSTVVYCSLLWSTVVYCALLWSTVVYCDLLWSIVIYCGVLLGVADAGIVIFSIAFRLESRKSFADEQLEVRLGQCSQ